MKKKTIYSDKYNAAQAVKELCANLTKAIAEGEKLGLRIEIKYGFLEICSDKKVVCDIQEIINY